VVCIGYEHATGGRITVGGLITAFDIGFAVGAVVGGIVHVAAEAGWFAGRAGGLAGRAGLWAADDGEGLSRAPMVLLRIFGGKSPAAGKSWTTPLEFLKGLVKPGGLRNYLGIGKWNTGEGLAIGFLRKGAQAELKAAEGVPTEGLIGGGLEVLANPQDFAVIWRIPWYLPP